MSRELWKVEGYGQALVSYRLHERYGRARIPGRCSASSPKCSRRPGDEVHAFPWAVVDLSTHPVRVICEAPSKDAAGKVVWMIGQGQACAACGRDYVQDEGAPFEILEPACDSSTCGDCGETYRPDDDRGVTIASTDELAAEHDPMDNGKCEACWAKINKEAT